MVNAKLHIICGNCGANWGLSLRNDEEVGPTIVCSNCSTLHFLETIMDKEE